jgi:hypothetical protein
MLLDLHHLKTESDCPARYTHAGQAGFACPDTRKQCGDCVFWDNLGDPTTQPCRRIGGTIPAPRRCRRYFELMGKPGARVPGEARACRFFQQQSPMGRK